jgi:hypothetical protein
MNIDPGYDYVADIDNVVDQATIDEVIQEAESYTRTVSLSAIERLGEVAVGIMSAMSYRPDTETAAACYWCPWF